MVVYYNGVVGTTGVGDISITRSPPARSAIQTHVFAAAMPKRDCESASVNDQAHPYLAQTWPRQSRTGYAACGAATPLS
eukprot:85054-Pleurochrysis_carterae.AAC.1